MITACGGLAVTTTVDWIHYDHCLRGTSSNNCALFIKQLFITEFKMAICEWILLYIARLGAGRGNALPPLPDLSWVLGGLWERSWPELEKDVLSLFFNWETLYLSINLLSKPGRYLGFRGWC